MNARNLRGYPRRLLIVIATMMVVRGVVAATWPLHLDEAYYWLWSRRLTLGYLDHPPLIAYLIFLTTRAGDAAFWVRLGAILVGGATSVALFLLGREMFNDRVGVLAALLFQFVPLAGLLAVPDTPLLLCWVLALYFIWQALHGRPVRWHAAGLAVGAGLLSKLSMVVLAMGIAAVLLGQSRSWWRRREPYQGLLLAALLISPFVYWNATHDWATPRFIVGERQFHMRMLLREVSMPGAPSGGTVSDLPRGFRGLQLLLAQQAGTLVFLLPVLLWAMAAAWRRRRDERFAFALWTAIPAVAFSIAASALAGFMAPSVAGAALVGFTVVAGAVWHRAMGLLIGGNVLLMIYGLLVPYFPLPFPSAANVFGWKEAADRVVRELAIVGGPAVVAADRCGTAAQIAYHTRDRIPVVLLPPPNPASIWPPLERYRGANAIAIIDTRWMARVDWRRYAVRVEEAAPAPSSFHGRTVRTFRVFRLYGVTLESPPAQPALRP